MSVLRSILFEEFTAVDTYGNPEDFMATLHVACAGFSYHDLWIEVGEGKNEAGTCLDIHQVRKLVAALNVFITDYERQKTVRCVKCDELFEWCGKYNDCTGQK